MPRPSQRAILEALPHSRLLELGRRFGIREPERVAIDTLVKVMGRAPRPDFRALVGHLEEDDLRLVARLLAFPVPAEAAKEALLDALVGRSHLRLIGGQSVAREVELVLFQGPWGAASEASGDLPGREDSFAEGDASPAGEPGVEVEPLGEASPSGEPPSRRGARGRRRASSGEAGDDASAPADSAASDAARAEAVAADEPGSKRRRGEGRRAELGFEATLWRAADKLRNNMDAAEYKHVVLGLIFLKFVSDAFAAAHGADAPSAPPTRHGARFWVPTEARWPYLAARAHGPEIGALVDAAMHAVERSNPSLRGVLPRHYERPDLDKQRLGELIDLIGTIGLGAPEDRSRDILGRVYEYFLTSFAAAEGKYGGQFYTPRSVVRLLVEMLAPYKGTVYDPACGSGGLFVQSERFIEEHGGRPGDIAIFGQESNPTTWRLAKMNLALRGIACDLGPEHADSFHRDLHRDLKADYVLANPPFNCRDWGRERLVDDPRWRYGAPPEKSANFAWVQHFIHHLAPRGVAGFVLANGAMSSVSAGEGEIRRAIVEDDLVDCMVALPSKLFYSTQIPVSLWFLARDKADPRLRDRRGETLFIDARGLGSMIDRIHRELTDGDVDRLAATYHAWRGDPGARTYADEPGFCRAVDLGEIRAHGHSLVPGHYVGGAAPVVHRAALPFAERFAPLAAAVEVHLARARALELEIRALLERLRR